MSREGASSSQQSVNRLFKRRKTPAHLPDNMRAEVPKLSDDKWQKTREIIRNTKNELAQHTYPRDDDYMRLHHKFN